VVEFCYFQFLFFKVSLFLPVSCYGLFDFLVLLESLLLKQEHLLADFFFAVVFQLLEDFEALGGLSHVFFLRCLPSLFVEGLRH
jgi:hypothetical protein